MALTKGQKKRRDTEYAEAKTVTDPERIAELLESRFNYLSFRVLAERHDIWPYFKKWFFANHSSTQLWQDPHARAMLLREMIKNPSLTDDDLSHAAFARQVTDKVLTHENCKDVALKAIGEAWSTGDVDYDHPDVYGIKGVSYFLTQEQWLRLFDLVGKKTLPPFQEGRGPYYSPTEYDRRDWTEKIEKFLVEDD